MADNNNKKMLLEKILMIFILSLVAINIPILILAILSIGGNAIFITLIVLTSIIIALITWYIVMDIIKIREKKQQIKQEN